MLLNLGDIKNDVLVKLQAATTMAFYSDSILNNWISEAHTWASSLHKWPFTEYQDNSLTFNSNGGPYPYPSNFRQNSVRFLQVGGKRFNKTEYHDYLSYLEDNSGGQARIWSEFGGNIYVNGSADASGTITTYGQILPAQLDGSDPTATTIFSNHHDEGNEAISEKVLSYATTREKSPVGLTRGKIISASMLHDQNAVAILENMWKSFTDEKFGYMPKDSEMWKRTDIIRGALRDDIFKRDQFY